MDTIILVFFFCRTDVRLPLSCLGGGFVVRPQFEYKVTNFILFAYLIIGILFPHGLFFLRYKNQKTFPTYIFSPYKRCFGTKKFFEEISLSDKKSSNFAHHPFFSFP